MSTDNKNNECMYEEISLQITLTVKQEIIKVVKKKLYDRSFNAAIILTATTIN